MRTIRVQTKTPYDVLIGGGILPTLGKRIAALPGKRYRRAVLVMDSRVRALYGRTASQSLKHAGLDTALFSYPPGEGSKNMQTVLELMDCFSDHYLTRSDLVVALGGGVCGDMAGFAAAIYQRGVDYVQVPTTLLAAIDSSVGGKTAVNLPAGKNLAGAFWQPQLVLCDTHTLHTLDPDVFIDGLAEAIKHGCIRDKALFELLEQADPHDESTITEVIARSVELKSAVVADDEREQGLRQILNFGHTLGHGIEKLSGWEVSHGKAVAVGMCLVADACVRRGVLAAGEAERIRAVLTRHGLPTRCTWPIEQVCHESLGDKKRSGNNINLITLDRIGHAAIYPLPVDQMTSFFNA